MTTFQTRPSSARKPGSTNLAVMAIPLFQRFSQQLSHFGSRWRQWQSQQHRWGVPQVFFFDEPGQPDHAAKVPWPEELRSERVALIEQLENILSFLSECISCRRVARALPELRNWSRLLAPSEPLMNQLLAYLTLPEDLVVRIVLPQTRQGLRLRLNGVRDVGHLLDELPALLTDQKIRRGFLGEGQFFAPTALQADGRLPAKVQACEHWYWGTEGLDRISVDQDGERTLLYGAAVIRTSRREGGVPLPVVPELELLQVMLSSEVSDWLERQTGRPVREGQRQAA